LGIVALSTTKSLNTWQPLMQERKQYGYIILCSGIGLVVAYSWNSTEYKWDKVKCIPLLFIHICFVYGDVLPYRLNRGSILFLRS
jgi:hypothetical protein